MKKLLIVTDTYLPRYDGVARFLSETLPKIQNFDIEIIAPDYTYGKEFKFDYPVTLFKPSKLSFSDYSPSFPKLSVLKEKVKSADLVFTHTIGPIGLLGAYYARKNKKVVISFVHSIDWELIAKALNVHKFFQNVVQWCASFFGKWIYNKCNLILVPSKETEDALIAQGIKAPKRILHLGTDVKHFSPCDDKSKAKEKMGFSKDDFIIGYCGRLSYEKDLMTLHKAYQSIAKSYPDKCIKLLIVGGGEEDLVKSLSGKNITITGFVSNVVDYYQIMDVFVLPSLTETSSIATMEAMSCELCCITTPVGFLKTYIEDGKNGMHFKTSDVQDLIDKLHFVIDNKDKRLEMAKAARNTIVESYTWDETTMKLNRILNTILENIHEK